MRLDNFIKHASKQADVLFTEGSMVARSDDKTITEDENVSRTPVNGVRIIVNNNPA